MTRIIALLLATSLASPLWAEDAPADGKGDMKDGFSLLEEGTKLLLRGFMAELEPQMDDLRQLMDDIRMYDPPEILPNGDIIIRRRQAPRPPAEGEIDL